MVFTCAMDAAPETDAPPPSFARLALFASGDFGFNLYWQSASFYLLFYYTEVAHVPVLAAAQIYFIASIWDGLMSLIIGLFIDRYADTARLRGFLIWGAVPLGLSFALAYVDWGSGIAARTTLFMLTHILFRTAYAAVNLPYLALSTRISRAPAAQSLLSGLRMFLAIIAAILIADFTVPLGMRLAPAHPDQRYLSVAVLFATVATLTIIVVGRSFRPGVALPPKPHVRVSAAFRHAVRNRAFVVLIGAMMAMSIAASALEKMVLYTFKYGLQSAAAGQDALTYMVGASAAAIPLWVFVSRFVGVRGVWMIAASVATALLLVFATMGPRSIIAVQIDLILLQCAIAGLNFGLWTMLPEVLNYGLQCSGIWQEGMVYGLNALMQRIALGISALVIGQLLAAIGFRTDQAMGPAQVAGLYQLFFLLPALFFALSALIMLFSPLRRGKALAEPAI